MPSISTSTSSPATSGPTPDGVPVRIRSPGKRVSDWLAKETIFASVTPDDLAREQTVVALVRHNLGEWQRKGLVPDMAIEKGDETTRLHRERGWTHWHHLFCARNLAFYALMRQSIEALAIECRPALLLSLAKTLDWGNKLCYYGTGAARESISHLFSNQAFNTFVNYGIRGGRGLLEHTTLDFGDVSEITAKIDAAVNSASSISYIADLFVTDPPYADAVNYQERAGEVGN